MKNLLTLFAFTVLLTSCGEKQPPAPLAKPPRFEAREHRFSAAFPGEPKRKSVPQSSPWETQQLHSYTHKVSPQLALLVTCEELPAAAVQDPIKTLQQSVRGAATLQRGTVVTESDARQDGNPARDYKIDCGTLIYQGRYVLAGSRLYNVAAFASKKLGTARPKEVNAFIDSFEILK